MALKQGSATIIRPTLSAVQKAQEHLRLHIDCLINENRCIMDENESSALLSS